MTELVPNLPLVGTQMEEDGWVRRWCAIAGTCVLGTELTVLAAGIHFSSRLEQN